VLWLSPSKLQIALSTLKKNLIHTQGSCCTQKSPMCTQKSLICTPKERETHSNASLETQLRVFVWLSRALYAHQRALKNNTQTQRALKKPHSNASLQTPLRDFISLSRALCAHQWALTSTLKNSQVKRARDTLEHSCRRLLHSIETYRHIKEPRLHSKRALFNSKEAYLHTKNHSLHSKESKIHRMFHSIQSHFHRKEPCPRSKRALFTPQKGTSVYKRALSALTRARDTLQTQLREFIFLIC